MRKRYYILFVTRGEDGQLRKIPIPVHYLYVLVVGAAMGLLGLTGIARSYMRMLMKTSEYNELRAEKDDLKNRYTKLEQVAKERDIQVASLGSLASEVSSLYGLKSDPVLVAAGSSDKIQDEQVVSSMDRLYTLKAEVVRAGVRALTGIDMPVNPKRRFQDGVRAGGDSYRSWRVSKAWCRQVFLRQWEDRLKAAWDPESERVSGNDVTLALR